MEEYKPVPGHPAYSVSNLGNVISRQHRGVPVKVHPKWIRSGKRGGVYLGFNATAPDGSRKTFKIHRLVAELFIGPAPADKPIVMHLDENKRNNTATNLQYGTNQENITRFHAHMSRLGYVRRESSWYHPVTGHQWGT